MKQTKYVAETKDFNAKLNKELNINQNQRKRN